MEIENESLFRHALSNGINLFLGAGFSVLASASGKKLPTGEALKDELLEHFRRHKPSTLNLAQLTQIISSTQKEELNSFFSSRLTVTDFPNEYKYLENISIDAIFTTNIDNLIHEIYSSSNNFYINDITLRGPVISGSKSIDYIPLHGCLTHGTGGYDFSPLDLASSFDRDQDKWYGYISRIKNRPTLYWGYRLEDASVLQALAKTSLDNKKRPESWIVLRSREDEAIEYYGSLGFQIIIAETKDMLIYLGGVQNESIKNTNSSSILNRFPEYMIPRQSSVPVRSISEFYLGAEPSWYDIYSGKVYETSHLSKAKNISINNNLVLIGGAVTGKTTLLKQIAAYTNGLGTPLYVEDMTPEKAQLLARDITLQNNPAIVFIDNAADASEAIQILVRCDKIKIVAAERDYIFDSVAHRFPPSKFIILDVSCLTRIDIQEIENRFPLDIARKRYAPVKDELSPDTGPTFLEFSSSTITENSIVDRFLKSLNEYKVTNPPAYEILVVACYCYASRVPISVDIATAYCRSYNFTVFEVMNFMERMGSMLSDYEGALAASRQSYYVPRSRQLAEVVLYKIPAIDLRRIIETFHQNVSPTKIGRYDVFRRSGYDARLMGRAFPEWRDGLHFYEEAFKSDSSYSLKQQGALYLSHKKNFQLAFAWIDDAISMTRRNNAAVNNSYAVILFNANYNKPSDTAVMATLDESMTILKKCYDTDHRKVYHARVFADQAIKYSTKFPNSPSACEYLETSHKWLTDELRHRPGDRGMNNLLRGVDKQIHCNSIIFPLTKK